MSYKRILVGTDGSQTSGQAVKEAAVLAKATGAVLLVLTAYQRPDQSLVESLWEASREGRKTDAPEEFQWRLTPGGEAQRVLDEALLAAAAEGVEAQTRIVEGEAAAAILDAAAESVADLIVLGSRGMAGASRFLLGSVPDKVAHHAPCDLFIVYTTGS